MPIIISEVAIQSDGTFAVELFNSDGVAASVAGFNLAVASGGGGALHGAIPAGTMIAAGGTLTLGHSSISGMDFTLNDVFFASLPLQAIEFLDNLLGTVDVFGGISDPALPQDVVFQSPASRTPDTTPSTSNLSDFTQIAGFSNNDLNSAPCFLPGTMIATPGGQRPVETLRPNDLVLCADGRTIPVLWLGRKQMRRRIGMARNAPDVVRICAGALDNHTDLFVTGDHGMIVGDWVINASALVNHRTVFWHCAGPNYTVYHIETEAHDVILANGAAVETFIDAAGRAAFDNYQEYLDLYGTERMIPQMNHPRISSARLIPEAIRTRLCTRPSQAKLRRTG